MRKILFLLILTSFCCIQKVWSQLNIGEGTKEVITGDTYIVVDNLDLVYNAGPQVLNGTIKFTGNNNAKIAGGQQPDFNTIVVAKTGTGNLILSQSISVEKKVIFESGLFELNSFNVRMSSPALIVGEREDSRFTGSNGGVISINVSLNAPSSVNPGNLGAIISSGSDMGMVTIKRGHQAQSVSSQIHPGILRYYDIIPSNNFNLNATLRLQYFDAELNGNNEAILSMFKTNPGSTLWENKDFSSRDAINNFVEKAGINPFSRKTLSDLQTITPIVPPIAKANPVEANITVAKESGAFITRIYPTIISGNKLYLQVGSAHVQKMQARVYDAIGRLLQNQQLSYQSQWLQLPNLSAGTYHIVLQSGILQYTANFMK